MAVSIFDTDDYRKYLYDVIDQKDGKSRGFRAYLADKIGCQRTFISQVLRGDANFNLEHADAISRVLGHSTDEADFFLLMILYARAGTHTLRTRFQAQMQAHRERRLKLKERFKEEDRLTLADKQEYYSSWVYGAIRVLVTIPKYRTRREIEHYFKLPPEMLSPAIDFLLSRGLLTEKAGKLLPNTKHLFLGNDSKLISKHHTNWRMKAVQSLDYERKTDLHFSAVNSLSREDVLKVREVLAQAIESARGIIRDSPEECLYGVCVDFFEV